MTFTVYMLRTSGNTLYTGYTNNLEKRLKEHGSNQKRGSKYMHAFSSFSLAYTEIFSNRSAAMKREAALKKLTKLQKEALVRLNSRQEDK